MTLPETLKAARIEAIAAALDEYGMALTSKNIARLLEADPLEQIASDLAEALKQSEIFVQLHCAQWGRANLLPDGQHHPTHQAILDKIDAALQKAGVR